MFTKSRSRRGFTLVEIMIVVAIIVLIAAIAIPGFANLRTTAATNSCKANLRQISGAVTAYAVDNGSDPTTVAMMTPNYIKTEPHCPYTPQSAYTVANGNVSCPNAGTYADHAI